MYTVKSFIVRPKERWFQNKVTSSLSFNRLRWVLHVDMNSCAAVIHELSIFAIIHAWLPYLL